MLMGTSVMSARIAERREAKGLTQTDLAKLMNVSPQSVQQWEAINGTSPRGKRLDLLSQVLEVPKSYFFGESPELSDPILIRDTVPLIDWVSAGNWGNEQPISKKQNKQIPTMFDTGPNGYALRVEGESMMPRYQPNDIIFINPDGEPSVGKRVIAACQFGTTFKELAIGEGGKMVLKALNDHWTPRYIALEEDCYVIGVVVGSVRPE